MADRCPCLSGESLENCCGRYLNAGQNAPTAERLMRSRFTAFAVGDTDYLLRTWHPSTRPSSLELDSGISWTRLDLLDRRRGGLLDVDGEVEFEAHFRHGSQRGSQHERSTFVRENGEWFYLREAATA